MPITRDRTRICLKNILITTDFSPAASAALPFAQTFARLYGSKLFIAHALSPAPRLEVVMDALPTQYDREWEYAREELHELEQRARVEQGDSENTLATTILERGDLEEVIPRIIQEHEIDLVILGTSGHRGVAKIFLGSGAEKIYRSAPCPVLTVGPKAPPIAYGESGTPWKIANILFPVDLAQDSGEALHYALSFAEENQARLVLLNAEALVPWQHRGAVEDRVRRSLANLIPTEAKNWCNPQYVVCWEPPADAILHTAHDWAIDLIVMGVHTARVAALSSHLPWPVASEVVSRTPCPVLTVRV